MRVKEGLGTTSQSGLEGGSGKISSVVGRGGIGILTMNHFICGFGNVGRTSVKEGLGTISRYGMGGGIGEDIPGGRQGRIRDYIHGCLGRWIGE
jgi:hypothetical protein